MVCGYILICLVCYRVELAGIRPRDLEGLSPGKTAVIRCPVDNKFFGFCFNSELKTLTQAA